jgi:U3 small nucleolar RNA-associated protein 13
MQQPGRLLSLFKSVRGGPDLEDRPKSFTGSAAVDEVIRTMSAEDLITLIKFVRSWNSNAKTSEVAQEILHAIVKLRSAEEIMDMFRPQVTLTGEEQSTDAHGGLKEIVDGLIPYTERHLARMERLIQESYVVDFLLEEMDQGMLCGGADLMEVDA